MKPLISVIVPVYKVEAYLPRCLDSIVNQTYRNLEIILVDDGSTDNCGTICDDYASRDYRIRVIHKENEGVSSARNAGLDVMQGEYLMFVDPDDWLSLDAVQVLYYRMMQDGSDMAVGRHIDVYENGVMDDACCSWMTDVCYSHNDIVLKMRGSNFVPVCAWGKLYKSALYLNQHFPDVRHAEDLAIYPHILDRCNKISTSEKVIYYYYQRPDSMMRAMKEAARIDCLLVNLHFMEYLLKKGCASGAERWFSRCVNQAFEFENKKYALSLIEEQYKPQEVKRYLCRQSWKVRVKWLAIHSPSLEKIVRTLKKVIRTLVLT